jgi:hypothetical protein
VAILELLYGSECWTVADTERCRFEAAKTFFLRSASMILIVRKETQWRLKKGTINWFTHIKELKIT